MADDILDEIKDLLNKATKGGKSKTPSDGDVKALSNALSKALTKASSSSEIKRLNQIYRDQIKQAKLSATAEKAAIKALEDETEEREKTIKLTKDLNEGYYKLFKNNKFSSLQQQKYADRAVAADGIIRDLGKAASSGSGKITDFTDVLSKRGAVGAAFADIGSGLENNLDMYRTLSNVGATFGQDLVNMRQAAQDAGLPLKDFGELIKNNSQVLAAYYGTTSQGAQQFARGVKNFRDLNNKALAPLGYTVEDLNSLYLTTIEIERRAGSQTRKTDKELGESALKLGMELDTVAKITGVQRKDLEKNMKSQMQTNSRFLAAVSDPAMPEGIRTQLQLFASTMKEKAPSMATAIEDLIANGGVAVTNESIKLVQGFKGIDGIVKQLYNGTATANSAFMDSIQLAKVSNEQNRKIQKVGLADFVDDFAVDMGALSRSQANLGAATAEARKRQSLLTNQSAEFQNTLKELTGTIQGLQTGFYALFGGAIGGGAGIVGGLLKVFTASIDGLSTSMKALLYVGGKTLGYLGDKALQVGIVYTGTKMALLETKNVNNLLGQMLPNWLTGGKGKKGKGASGMNTLGKVGTGLSVVGAGASVLETGSNLVSGDKARQQAGIVEAIFGSIGAGLGFMAGGPIGAAAGLTIGTGAGSLINSLVSKTGTASPNPTTGRALGTLGATGQSTEPKNVVSQLHQGEAVLTKDQAKTYQMQGDFLQKLSTKIGDLVSVGQDNNKILTNIAYSMADTAKNTGNAASKLGRMGPSLIG
jgi:hypothetical protein